MSLNNFAPNVNCTGKLYTFFVISNFLLLFILLVAINSTQTQTTVRSQPAALFTKAQEGLSISELWLPSRSPTVNASPIGMSPGSTDKLVYTGFDTTRSKKQIYLINIDGTNRTNLSNSNTDDTNPVFSRSGAKIAFIRNGNLAVMNADGSSQILLSEAWDEPPAWSADGGQIIFKKWNYGENPDLFVINVGGTGLARVTNTPEHENWFCWSPDGSKIAFAKNSSVYTINANGTSETSLWTGSYEAKSVTWSPNGQSLAWINWFTRELTVSQANGTNQRIITDSAESDGSLSWSSDSTRIAYAGIHYTTNWVDDIFTVSISGGTPVLITSHPAGASYERKIKNVTWSPNGTQIGYSYAAAAGSSDLYMMNPDGSGRIRINQESLDNVRLVWLPVSNAMPTVNITAPASNASFVSGSNITVSATATDSDGTISKVEFYQGATKLGEDITAPYSYVWSNVATGDYALTVKAFDNGNAVNTSSITSIRVLNNTPPTASITSPSNNASFITSSNITINANAADSGGSIAKVEFFQGTNKLGEDLAVPYSYAWSNVAAGTYTLTVKATDNNGAITTSSTISVSVVQGGTISGKITKFGTTTPVVGATVKLYQGMTLTSSLVTDTSGNYTKELPAGSTYAVETTAAGYKLKTQVNVSVIAGSTSTVNLALDTDSGPIAFVYDVLGRISSVVDPGGNKAVYQYDASGNLLSIANTSSNITYVTGFSPTSSAVGTPVTIYGTKFSATPSQNTVKFNGTTATVVSSTVSQIVANVPSGATTGPITVTAPAGTATSTSSFTVRNSASPTITNFTPTVGSAGGSVTITGTNFQTTSTDNIVTINGARTSVTSATTTNVQATIPNGVVSGRVGITTPGGQALSVNDLIIPPAGFTSTDVSTNSRITFGETKTLTINAANKISLLLFNGTAGQHVGLSVDGVNIPGSTEVKIYQPNGSQLTFSSVAQNDTHTIDIPTLPVTGTYTVLIDPAGMSTGSMTFKLNDLPTNAAPTIVAGGALVTISTTRPGQSPQAVFSGTGTLADRISIELRDSRFVGSYALYLRGPDEQVVNSIWTYNSYFLDTLLLPGPGNYRIVVGPSYPVGSTGSVTLKLNKVPFDVTSNITINGSPVSVTTTTAGQNASLSFSGTAGQQISLSLNGNTIPGRTSVYLRGPVGGQLAVTSIDQGGTGVINTVTLPETGTYTIYVDPVAKNSGTGSIAVTLTSP